MIVGLIPPPILLVIKHPLFLASLMFYVIWLVIDRIAFLNSLKKLLNIE